MERLQLLATLDDNQKLYQVRKGDICHLMKNWERNRPEDALRVEEIKKYQCGKQYTEGIIYAWCKGANKGILYIYDGWTRYCAATPQMKLFLQIYTTLYESDIENHFIALNRAVPVPYPYVAADGNNAVIKDVCKQFSEKYKMFQSASKRPNKSHFNRDSFMEQLSQLPIEGYTSLEVLQALENANDCIRRTKQSFPEKAMKGGLFLFADKKINWQEHFTKQLDKVKQKEEKKTWFSFL